MPAVPTGIPACQLLDGFLGGLVSAEHDDGPGEHHQLWRDHRIGMVMQARQPTMQHMAVHVRPFMLKVRALDPNENRSMPIP